MSLTGLERVEEGERDERVAVELVCSAAMGQSTGAPAWGGRRSTHAPAVIAFMMPTKLRSLSSMEKTAQAARVCQAAHCLPRLPLPPPPHLGC